MSEETEEDDHRWGEVADLAQGVADEGRLRLRRNRVFLLLTAIILSCWLAGLFLALVLPHSADAREGVPDSRLLAGLMVEAIGFAALIGGFIWALRTGRYVTRRRSIAAPLTRRQRRSAQRTIAGKERLDPDRKRYLMALAEQNRRTTEGIVPLYGAILLFNSFTLFIDPKPFQIVLSGLVVALFAGAAIQLTLIYRRSGRFIMQNGDAG